MRAVIGKDCDVLLCSEDVDEFALQTIGKYQEKEFKNVNTGDLELETEAEKKAAAELAEENKELFAALKEALDGRVTRVIASTLLKEHPVSLSADGPVSLEMEKVLSRIPGRDEVKSEQVLELNPEHPVFQALQQAQAAGDGEKVKRYAELLYDQARLIEGLDLEDPVAFSLSICELMR